MTESERNHDRSFTQVRINLPDEKPRKATDALDVVRELLERKARSTRDRLFITDVIEGLDAFVMDVRDWSINSVDARAAGSPDPPPFADFLFGVEALSRAWNGLRDASKEKTQRDRDPTRTRQKKGDEDMSRLIEEVVILGEQLRLCEKARVTFRLGKKTKLEKM